MTNQILRILVKKLFTGCEFFEECVLTLADGKIAAVDSDLSVYDRYLSGVIVPSLIDLQVNGAGGVLFNESPTLNSLKVILKIHSSLGTASILPTVITDDISIMQRAADTVSLAFSERMSGILGLHFEGPHISKAKKGTHEHKFIRAISDEEWSVYLRKDIGQVMVTLAPEVVSSDDIKRLVDSGVLVSLGHTNAPSILAKEAYRLGVNSVTHLYNAMSPLTAREPGVTGSALLDDRVYCGIIADGHHVCDSALSLALKSKPKGKVYLVSDSMMHLGTTQKHFKFFNRKISLSKEGFLTSSTGELAGANISLLDAVKYCISNLKVPFEEAIRMACVYPSNYLNSHLKSEPEVSQLCVGNSADFIQLDEDLNVLSTWIGGKCVFLKK